MSIATILAVMGSLEIHRYRNENPVGGDGAGVSFVDGSGSIAVYKVGKTNGSPVDVLSRKKEVVSKQANTILAHVRRASPEFAETAQWKECTQPYKVSCLNLPEIVSAHNGKVENYMVIKNNLARNHQYESEKERFIDSEVIPHLFEELLKHLKDEIEARRQTFKRLEGNNTAVFLTRYELKGHLHILHKGKTRGLHVWANKDREFIVCSREEPVREVLDDLLVKRNFKKAISIERQDSGKVEQTYELQYC